MKLLMIGCGGFFGAILRYLVSKTAVDIFGYSISYGTLFVNVSGSFVLGLMYTLAIDKLMISENIRFLVGVGFLGAFTTFSTFSVESVHLFEDGHYMLSILNIFLNVTLSIAGAAIGIAVAKL